MSLGLGLWWLAGPLCPRARPAPTAQRCTKWQEFSSGEGIAALSTPVQYSLCALHPSPCTPSWVVSGRAGAVHVGRSVVVLELGPACTLRIPFSAGGRGVLLWGQTWGRGVSCWHPAERPSPRCAHPGRRSLPSEHNSLGAVGRSRRATPDCGRLSKTDDGGRLWGFFASSVKIPF